MTRWVMGMFAAALVVTLSCSPPAGTTPAAAPPSTSPAAKPSSPAPSPPPRTTRTRPALQYVALGDSLASGMGGEASYADVYRRLLQRRTRRDVELTNLARPGWTSGQLLNALQTDGDFRTAVAQAEVVTWDVGGNDIIAAVLRTATNTCGGPDGLRCVRQTTDGFRSRWAAIVAELSALRASPDVRLLTFDLYMPFLPPAARTDAILGQLAEMNATIRASNGSTVAVAPVARAFAESGDTRLLSDDGLHPSAAGHRLIARLLLDLGLPRTP